MKNAFDLISNKPNYQQAKILVIDDNDDQWLLMREAMEQCLREVHLGRVASPHQAWELMVTWDSQQWNAPKLILLDLYLPQSQQGWQVLKRLKALGSPFNQIPVIVFSSSDSQVDITTSYQLGAASYLIKPLEQSGWALFFQEVRAYWWETTTLPNLMYKI